MRFGTMNAGIPIYSKDMSTLLWGLNNKQAAGHKDVRHWRKNNAIWRNLNK
uniref:Uncharacterized protein n=1 Tax=Meloidogyne incognita TaxID=6306 RepID=A0A914LCU4_MELIC